LAFLSKIPTNGSRVTEVSTVSRLSKVSGVSEYFDKRNIFRIYPQTVVPKIE